MGGAIDMDNNSITNANSLSINDPGEGITFSGGSLGNFILEMRDEAVDNMMELFSNTSSDTEFNIHNTGAGDMSVGINTDTPSEALHVVGSIRSTDLTASRALVSGANGVIESSSIITTTELGYLNGVTSNIQDQLDAIGNTIDGSGSSNKVAYWSDSDTLTYHGSITATELGFLNGATSNIQQQIDGKEPTLTKGNLAASGPISLSATRQVIGGGATISISQAGISSDGYLSSTDWSRFNDVAIGAGSIAMLGAAFLVSTQSTGSTTLYTVPSWKYCFLTHVIIDAENDQTGAKVNIGKSGQYEWTNISLDALTSLHDWAMINHNFSTTPAANQMYSGGDNIIINVHSGTGVSSSINVWLFGFIRE